MAEENSDIDLCSYEGETQEEYVYYDPAIFGLDEEESGNEFEYYPGPWEWEEMKERGAAKNPSGIFDSSLKNDPKTTPNSTLNSNLPTNAFPDGEVFISTMPEESGLLDAFQVQEGVKGSPEKKIEEDVLGQIMKTSAEVESSRQGDEKVSLGRSFTSEEEDDDDYFDFPDVPKRASKSQTQLANATPQIGVVPALKGRDYAVGSKVKAITSISLDELFKIEEKEELPHTEASRYKLFVDGSSLNNPGHAGGGAVLFSPSGKLVFACGVYLGVATNNEAEYMGLLLGLKLALTEDVKRIDVHSDSKLVVNQVLGTYRLSAQHLKKYLSSAQRTMDLFEKFSISHVRRRFNSVADMMANRAAAGGRDGVLKVGDLIQTDEA
jgi:ribonuclease HI